MGCSRAHAHKNIEHIKQEPILYMYREILFYFRQTTPQNKGTFTAKNLLLWGNGIDGYYGIPFMVKI